MITYMIRSVINLASIYVTLCPQALARSIYSRLSDKQISSLVEVLEIRMKKLVNKKKYTRCDNKYHWHNDNSLRKAIHPKMRILKDIGFIYLDIKNKDILFIVEELKLGQK